MDFTPKFSDGKFRVMLVGDPHEAPGFTTEKEKAVVSDYLALQYAAVKELKPDLVILMGDNAGGKTPDEIRQVLLRMTKPYQESNIPFAFVLGNHDLEHCIDDIEELYDIYRTIPCCILPYKNQVNSFGDYNITVKSEYSDADAFNFWLMYSGNRGAKDTYSYYDYVKPEQISWYENKAQELKEINGKAVPSIVIQHIPVQEEFRLLKERSIFRMITDGVLGQNEQQGKYYTLDKNIATGYLGEAPCASAYNSGQFTSWKNTGDVIAAFFGHDHMNDFVGMVDGIILGQCKTAGFNPYGDGLMQGVRIVDIYENNTNVIETKMVRYRDLIGSECNSIHGLTRLFPDRISVKFDILTEVVKYSAPIVLPLIGLRIIKKIKK